MIVNGLFYDQYDFIMKKILVPTDFSLQADYATDFAIQVAAKKDAEVTLLHVIEHPSADTFNTMGISQSTYDPMENLYIMKMMESAKSKLEATIGKPEYSKINLKFKIVIGNPYREMTREITDMSADLVIMGTTGTTNFPEKVLGSNIERVIRNSKCPVISIRERTALGKIQNIVFASDFVLPQDELVMHIKSLQAFFNAKLRLVRVNTPYSFTTSRHDTQLMKKFVEHYKLDNYTLDIYNATVEEEGIIFFANDIDADMIALGTHGRTGIAALISGSIAEDVANNAMRPVYTYKIR